MLVLQSLPDDHALTVNRFYLVNFCVHLIVDYKISYSLRHSFMIFIHTEMYVYIQIVVIGEKIILIVTNKRINISLVKKN